MSIDARIIDRIRSLDSLSDTSTLIATWRVKVKTRVYRISDGQWKRSHQPVLLRWARKRINDRLFMVLQRMNIMTGQHDDFAGQHDNPCATGNDIALEEVELGLPYRIIWSEPVFSKPDKFSQNLSFPKRGRKNLSNLKWRHAMKPKNKKTAVLY